MSRAASAASFDVVIVGGGPAGLVTGIAARRQGLSALVVERRAATPLDKPCGEGLMPDGLAALARIGVVLDGSLGGRPLAGIRYLDGDTVAEAQFERSQGLGMRRTTLHHALLDSARAAGVDVRFGVRAEGLEREEDRFERLATTDGSVAGRFFVAADGLRSPLRAMAGLDRPEVSGKARRFGVRRHLRVAPWSDFVEVYWSDASEAYVTPVGPEEIGVALLWRGRAKGFESVLEHHPALARRLRGAGVTSRDAGCGPLRQRVRAVTRDNLALVGDAAGYVDAITGEGLALAFHQAEALGLVLGLVLGQAQGLARDPNKAQGDLGTYRRAHRRIVAQADAMTWLVLTLARRPKLRRHVVQTLARRPRLFARLLAVHTREAPVRRAILPVLRLLTGA